MLRNTANAPLSSSSQQPRAAVHSMSIPTTARVLSSAVAPRSAAHSEPSASSLRKIGALPPRDLCEFRLLRSMLSKLTMRTRRDAAMIV